MMPQISLSAYSKLKSELAEVSNRDDVKKELKKLDNATRNVEALFIKTLIGQMRKSGMKTMLGNGMEAQMYSDFLDQAVASEISKAGGVGIGKMLYKTMAETLLRQKLAASKMQNQMMTPADTAVRNTLGTAATGAATPVQRPQESRPGRFANEN